MMTELTTERQRKNGTHVFGWYVEDNATQHEWHLYKSGKVAHIIKWAGGKWKKNGGVRYVMRRLPDKSRVIRIFNTYEEQLDFIKRRMGYGNGD